MADEQDYECQFSEEAGILRVVVRGRRDFARSQRLVALIRTTADERGCRRVLLDTSALTEPPPNEYRFALGELLATEWRGLRVAVINPLEAGHGFVETVAVNRGATTRIFKTEDTAIEWLQLG
ncbi:MAG TPA: hypothetical protein VEU54_03175 [Steroidobacteraceae bacterium]|jgi:hypothetical protein|nr:hypothetical protein [Steroidobacteraceae bacterium]